jgi:hypothetical protein
MPPAARATRTADPHRLMPAPPRNTAHPGTRLAAVAVLALAAALLLVACARSDDPTAPQPKKVYKDAFETPLDLVQIEADGGSIVGAYDAWLRLLPNRELTPRFAADYRPADCGPVLVYFNPKLALEGLSLDGATLSCREYRNPRLPFENGRWLAEDAATGRVHYRIWKFR